MTHRRWRPGIVAAALLAIGSLVVASPPPAAGSSGACPGASGVTVVVDYGALGGGIAVGCAPGTPATGFKALMAAGFTIDYVHAYPGFALCRIDGRPGPGQEDCVNMPPPTAWWSYWHADRGGSWTLSTDGGGTRRPSAGTVEGWSFSAGAATPPTIDPPAVAATPRPATPRPETPAPAGPSPGTTHAIATATPTVGPGSGLTASGPTGSPTAAPPTAASPLDDESSAASRPPSGDPPGASAAAVAIGDGASPPDAGQGPADVIPTGGGGPPLGTMVGLGLVVLVAAGGGAVRSRRSRGSDRDG